MDKQARAPSSTSALHVAVVAAFRPVVMCVVNPGINNKARVITKRCYGVKSPGTLCNGLILDLKWASDAAGRGVGELREIVSGLKAVPSRGLHLRQE